MKHRLYIYRENQNYSILILLRMRRIIIHFFNIMGLTQIIALTLKYLQLMWRIVT